MLRAFHTLLLAVAILAAFIAAPCVACTDQPMKGHGCCTPTQNHCPSPASQTLHMECGTPALQSFVVEADHTPVPMPVVDAASAAEEPIILVFHTEPPEVPLYSPPDLYLLNSVLTI